MMRPLILPLEILGKRQKSLLVSQELLPVYNQVISNPFTYNDYVLSHLLPDFNPRELIMSYLEGYPVLENCRFVENEFKETL